MSEKSDEMSALVPRLRFPEFQEAGQWTTVELGNLSQLVTDKVGTSACTPYTITTGVGLVSQEEKLGRTIAGDSLKNYIVLNKNDFAYNKSATKAYPQGFIACYIGEERAAVPNSIFRCFRLNQDSAIPAFVDKLFSINLHGRWLRNRIAVGARAHGSLQVNDDDLMALPVPLPSGSQALVEQQKIADCLSSLDELITAETQKLDALKTHKKGLMQQLFPRDGETLPRLRFSAVRRFGSWKSTTLSGIATIRAGATPSRAEPAFFSGGTIPWVKTTDLNNGFISHTEECITPAAKARVNPVGSVLVAMYGGFNQIGRTGYLTVPAATNQAISVLTADENEVLPIYLLTWMNARVESWKKIASSSRKDPNITSTDVAKFPIAYPCKEEQQQIADALASLDDLISIQIQRVDTFKTHKKGLMQQLFPALDEVRA